MTGPHKWAPPAAGRMGDLPENASVLARALVRTVAAALLPIARDMLPMLRLLVVDRSPALFHALQPLAREFEFEMVVCPSLADAFAEMTRFQPNVAVIDPDLGDLGGIGAVRGIRAVAPICEVVLTSIDPTSELGLEAVKAGALECVTKGAIVNRLRTVLLHASTAVPRMAQPPPREIDVMMQLDGESTVRFGRFTSVEQVRPF